MTPYILAIDPGCTESAYVLYDGTAQQPGRFAKVPNADVMQVVNLYRQDPRNTLVVEQIASYGMAVGAEVFETVFWSGRFVEAWAAQNKSWDRIKRMAVKMSLCHDSRAKDANIRQSLIDLYGGKAKAIGCKAAPGPLYGMAGDCWAAMAVAVVYAGKHAKEK